MKIKQTLDLRIVTASLIIIVLIVATSCSAASKGYTGRKGGCNATRYTIV